MKDNTEIEKQYKNYDFLYEEYIVLNKTTRDISLFCGVSKMTILRWLKKHNISHKKEEYKNKEWLYCQYITNKKTSIEISDIFGVSPKTILYWLKKFDIKIRNDFSGKGNPFFGKKHTEETKNILSNIRKGSKHTEESKIKMSILKTGKLLGDKNPVKRKEVRNKISLSLKKKYKENPQLAKNISIRMKKRLSNKENHPNYGRFGKESFGWKNPNDRKTNITLRIRNSDEYKKWRGRILERDKYVCQHCGKTNTYLEVHHIISLSETIKINNITNDNLLQKITNCLKLWDDKNGITLCKECHKKTDSYGAKNKYI